MLAGPPVLAAFREDVATLHRLAREVVATAAVPPNAEIARGVNMTGHTLHQPGGSASYPAFWVRDAAMMLGADLISADEIEGWIRVIAATQPGPDGLKLQHGLQVPGYSIPDHVNGNGKPVWFPGTYADGDDQGTGLYGSLPPADDAFYFIQMVREHWRLAGRPGILTTRVATGWGTHAVIEVCDRAFAAVAVDPASGIVVCEAAPDRTRVDWGFCDSVRKTGLVLFPTLLRQRAARELAEMHEALGEAGPAESYRRIADQLRESVARVFLQATSDGEALLLSATGLGRKYDIWGSSFALAEHLLPDAAQASVGRGLRALYQKGGVVVDGQVRAMPPDGPFGGFWEQAASRPGEYQNGGYWGTMSGWLIVALRQVDPPAADHVLHELVASVVRESREGAPWEWINPALKASVNPRYCATVALPYTTLRRAGLAE